MLSQLQRTILTQVIGQVPAATEKAAWLLRQADISNPEIVAFLLHQIAAAVLAEDHVVIGQEARTEIASWLQPGAVNQKTLVIRFRVSPAEKAYLLMRAEEEDASLSDYVRERVL